MSKDVYEYGVVVDGAERYSKINQDAKEYTNVKARVLTIAMDFLT